MQVNMTTLLTLSLYCITNLYYLFQQQIGMSWGEPNLTVPLSLWRSTWHVANFINL